MSNFKKLLVDFDGVWTDLREQALCVEQTCFQILSTQSGLPLPFIEKCIADVREIICLTPESYGWKSNGQISAFADEDPFLFNNAVVEAIEELAQNGHPHCEELYQALSKNNNFNMTTLVSDIFHQGCSRYLTQRGGHKILGEAKEFFHRIIADSHVVVCTNFASDKVQTTLEKEGFIVQTNSQAPGLSIRGFACKNELSKDRPKSVIFGQRTIAVHRQKYLDILCQELPDFIVGDVFSLDLALPLWLTQTDHRFGHTKCFLVINSYTPTWSRQIARDTTQISGIKSIASGLASLF